MKSISGSGLDENIVASAVDVLSILVAYNIGLHHMGIHVGVMYAAFDAWLVIWQRKKITTLVRKLIGSLRFKHE